MSVQRVRCRSEDCTNTILPVTAAAYNGYCAPCAIKRKQAERDEYIRTHRRKLDPRTLDPIELIKILHTRSYDPLIEWTPPPKTLEELYAGLRADQIAYLKRLAIDALCGEGRQFAEDVAQSLANFTTAHLGDLLDAWVSANHLWPSIIFRGADASIRDRIVQGIETGLFDANHALSALAWIGDEEVVKLFRIWEAEPRWWRASLYAGPSRYAHQAGWEPSIGGRRNLYFENCFAIRPAGAREAVTTAIELLGRSTETCRWCGAEMVLLFNMDLRDPTLEFLPFSAPRLPVLTCYGCTCYGDNLFAQFTEDGTARWLESNIRPDWLPEKTSALPASPWQGVPSRLFPRRAFHAAGWCTSASISQVGGLPSWVQDTAYPQCPGCKQTMKFIAQLDNGQFPGHEGVYYGFACTVCNITATTYQQT